MRMAWVSRAGAAKDYARLRLVAAFIVVQHEERAHGFATDAIPAHAARGCVQRHDVGVFRIPGHSGMFA